MEEVDLDRAAYKKPERKTTKQRKREIRRKLQEQEKLAKDQQKALAKQLNQLSAIMREVESQQAKSQAKGDYRRALVAYWNEAKKQGRIQSFKIGNKSFKETPDSFLTESDLAMSDGSLRKLPVGSDRVALRDRLVSIKRRGLIELQTDLTKLAYQQQKDKLRRIIRQKKKDQRKASWMLP
eukprot:Blabericola_migrator_1__20@NODE_1006_length_5721_cov_24_862575_g414_i2_p2_GENE_NODE_1006_length_5721_cov_24_862575_g414_i2NODE_1006_length_5721_cov_24_862575_g414_i2_p2_ORF_typecomplete_len181_score41_55Nop53/PF07767_11/2_7e15Nop53/PF07767_11/5_8e02Plasmid_RAQPRD/PF09686_10/0_13Plasmid_RAQPRD/PF09686_10/2_4e03Plasmid_RAQPRD/PF09686_10/6_2e02DUF4953/PF16313_5/0_11DUF4953/PF16313_5/2_1e03TEX13/PF15186_6/0_66TEX13/PF15186_6/1_7e02LCIB_C_CA/PF18599_1/4_4e02LCIB_C_CA/PF18599_1/0_59DUF3347/PF11827_8/0